MKVLKKNVKTFNYFLLIIFGILLLSTFYYLYHRQRSQAWVYITVSLVRPQNTYLNIPYNSVPYWTGDAISVGDQEKSLLGSVGAIVVDKESYEWINFGQVVSLTLKVNSTKDRTGVYLYKNTPLLVGSLIDLKLNKVQSQGLVTAISDRPILKDTKQFEITLVGKQVEPWITDSLKIGDEAKNNKGDVMAKIKSINVLSSGAPVTLNNGTGTLILDTSRSNIEIVVDLSCQMIGDECYFAQTEKVKTNETIYLSFKSVSINYPITQIKLL